MNITARVENKPGSHSALVATMGQERSILIPPKTEGAGSSVNGGELLMLALATCYCNDVYREARKQNIHVHSVRVEVRGEFGPEGGGAKKIVYDVETDGTAPREDLLALLRYTDTVAEIQNTLRASAPVELVDCRVNSI